MYLILLIFILIIFFIIHNQIIWETIINTQSAANALFRVNH